MSSGPNLVQSVRQRLVNIARSSGDDIQRILVRYAIERLLYRMSISPYRNRFVLKGATLFSIWTEAPYRSTGDLDLLGQSENTVDALKRVFAEIAALASDPDDGLEFDVTDIRTQVLRADSKYAGVSLRFDALLGRARLPIMVDIGYGDVITPGPEEFEFPSLLAMPTAKLKAYPPETVVAEKMEAMVSLGVINSRVKDLYDIWAIARSFELTGAAVVAAIKATFERRGTALGEDPPSMLTPAYAAAPERQQLWRAFLESRAQIDIAPAQLVDAAREVEAFIAPVLLAARTTNTLQSWSPKEWAWTSH